MDTALPLPVVVPVAGISFRQEGAHGCAVGDPVQIVADRASVHDRNAHAVFVNHAHVGYVPAQLAARLARHGRSSYLGTVEQVLTGRGIGLRVKIHGPEPDTPEAAALVTATPPDAQDAPAAVAGTAVQVVTGAGRTLGVLVARHGRQLQVRLPSGHDVTVAADAVRLVGDEPSHDAAVPASQGEDTTASETAVPAGR